MHRSKDAVVRRIMHHRQTRVLAALVLMLGLASAVYCFGSVVARAQNVADSASAASEQVDAAPQALSTPPAPCAAQEAGACPAGSCTTDVPGASEYENSLPVPSPMAGFNYVVQLVNESDVTVLAGVNAAHRGSSVPNGPVPTPIAVEPREGTWLMCPKGSTTCPSVLTIDIPPQWEGTQCPQNNTDCKATGPRFFARTGCKYDIANNLAQCETGSCGDAYDCGKQALLTPPRASAGSPPVSIVEWTFNSQGGQGYEYPDISLVDGVNLTVDVQAIGQHCASKPGVPTEPNWLSENQPLAMHGVDLREPDRCIPNFRLTRQQTGQFIQGGSGNPDDVVACFTNCGRYEYPNTPGAGCDPTSDQRCKNWLAFCCYAPAGDPNGIYGGACTENSDCRQQGGCWDNGNGSPFCSCRAFIKNETCAADVCTHPNPPDKASQPELGHCTDVTTNPDECIGDDTVHEVFPSAYTWPNDPQTYVSDARAYRIIFAPGGTSVPITEAATIPDCDTLPEPYGYDFQSQVCSGVAGKLFAGAALSPACEKTDDCPIIPGSTPPTRSGCDPLHKRCSTWACAISPGGPVNTGGLLCRWPAADPTPTSTPQLSSTPPTGQQPTATPARKSESDDGCAVAPHSGSSATALLSLFAAAALLGIRRRAR